MKHEKRKTYIHKIAKEAAEYLKECRQPFEVAIAEKKDKLKLLS